MPYGLFRTSYFHNPWHRTDLKERYIFIMSDDSVSFGYHRGLPGLLQLFFCNGNCIFNYESCSYEDYG